MRANQSPISPLSMALSPNRSKKQSAGSRRRPASPPEDFVFFLDENLHNCKPILDALVQEGINHERHGSPLFSGNARYGMVALCWGKGLDLNHKRQADPVQ